MLRLFTLLLLTSLSLAQHYYPPAGSWESRPPAELGFDPGALARAVTFARSCETDMPADFSTQAEIFGRPLGPLPASRAATNGLIVRRGYIASEWGDTAAVDPSYSVAKSYLSTILGLALDRRLISSIDDPVALLVKDGGYDDPHNAPITWHHHVTQTSEWMGELFGKDHAFIGKDEYGKGAMKPRALKAPGEHYEYNDVRINRFALSLLRVWKRPLPEVLRAEIMDPIGASDTWRYIAYDNATVDLDGTPVPSISGGTRWGGGLWMSSRDHARYGLLLLRRGEWNGRRILSESWITRATSPQGQRPDYGFLWWLNTTGRWPAASEQAFSAQGAGQNTIFIDPARDLVIVWRWHSDKQAEFYRLVIESLR